MNSNSRIKETINLLIIDDHKMVREGLKIMMASLKNSVHFNVQEAESGKEALTKINRFNFDVAIVDYQMPGMSGVETIQRILRLKPHLKILALSNYDELSYIESMMDAGANGFVLKNIEPGEMLKALRTILSNKIYYCNDVSIKIIEAAENKNTQKVQLEKILSTRETEVLRMIAMEMTNDEIAQKLFLSKRTIDTHRQNLINKLNVKNTAGLVKAAYKFNLIEQ
ncbi:MAG: response regulator transcription factor [Bacteroidota bacterium]|nr:response regulator transcription factor [Bacteroidota bacterium]